MLDQAHRSPSPARALCAVAALACVIAAGVALAAAIQGTVTRTEVIRAEPLPESTAVGTVEPGATVSVLERRGFWRRIESEAGNGWLRMSSVRVESGASTGSGLAALATGRGATGNIVTTSGTRGISAADLTGAAPDTTELQQVEALGVTTEQARAFAQEAGLTDRTLAYVARNIGAGQSAGRDANVE
jgi:hypothetical protein